MSVKVSMDELSDAVNAILLSMVDDVKDTVDQAANTAGKETAQKLRETSPRRTGKYAKGWKPKKEAVNGGTVVTVHNKDHYRLTHLLEYGHANVKGGRTPAHPHIKAAEDYAADEFERLVLEGLEK